MNAKNVAIKALSHGIKNDMDHVDTWVSTRYDNGSWDEVSLWINTNGDSVLIYSYADGSFSRSEVKSKDFKPWKTPEQKMEENNRIYRKLYGETETAN